MSIEHTNEAPNDPNFTVYSILCEYSTIPYFGPTIKFWTLLISTTIVAVHTCKSTVQLPPTDEIGIIQPKGCGKLG